MLSRRGKSEIIRDILLEMSEESSKTRILHRANLNLEVFPRYLKVLQNRGYIESLKNPQGNTLFRRTSKGQELLRRLSEIQKIIEDIRNES